MGTAPIQAQANQHSITMLAYAPQRHLVQVTGVSHLPNGTVETHAYGIQTMSWPASPFHARVGTIIQSVDGGTLAVNMEAISLVSHASMGMSHVFSRIILTASAGNRCPGGDNFSCCSG